MDAFRQSTDLAYVYVPCAKENFYYNRLKRCNVVSLIEKLNVYNNPTISINNVVKSYFDDHHNVVSTDMEHYIRWLHTAYVVNERVFIHPW